MSTIGVLNDTINTSTQQDTTRYVQHAAEHNIQQNILGTACMGEEWLSQLKKE
jgi:hypothetical protein